MERCIRKVEYLLEVVVTIHGMTDEERMSLLPSHVLLLQQANRPFHRIVRSAAFPESICAWKP